MEAFLAEASVCSGPLIQTLATLALILVGLHSPLGAQITPNVPGGPLQPITFPSVDPNRLPSTGPYNVTFYVVNIDTLQHGGDFTCTTTGPATCGTVTPSNGTVPAGDSIAVVVTYSTTASTGAAAVVLTATPEPGLPASASRLTNVRNAGKAGLSLLSQRNLDRGLCLTVGAGDAAGVSCGDLFVVQSMPTFRSLGRDRSIALRYGSEVPNGLRMVVGRVTEPNTIAMPSQVRVVLTIFAPLGQQLKDSVTYAPPGINPVCTTFPCAPYSDPQQFVIRRTAALAAGVYPITVTVRNIYPAVTLDSTVADTILVLGSPVGLDFGKGWSLLGLEQIAVNPADSLRAFWFSGDGSARLYAKPAGQPNSLVFYGAPGDAPDSLVRFDTLGVKWYRRDLKHGAAVLFDQLGFHRVTRNRAGQQTIFTWGTIAGKQRLISITVPPKRASPLTYSIVWNATTARLDSIIDPAGRRLVATIGSDTLLSKLVVRSLGDTTTYETRFTYSGGRMASRAVVRRDLLPGKLATTTYAYGNNARVTSVTIPYDTVSTGRTALTTFAPWDEKGLTVLALVDTAGLPTRVDGPIAGTGDAADFWIDPLLGGPKKIVGLGLKDTTTIRRDVVANPGLISQVQYPNRRTVVMTWNPRANLLTVRDSTKKCGIAPCDSLPTKVTTYTYGDSQTPDSPTRVQDALGRHSDFTYDALGLTSLATDTRTHRTQFFNRIAAADTLRGLVDSIAEINVMTWIESTSAEILDTLTTRFHYDSTTGNLLWLKSPLGVITSYKLDLAGNVTEVVDPMRNRTVFGGIDAWNRVGNVNHEATKSTAFPSYNPLADCLANQILCTDSLAPGGGTQIERYFLNVVGLDSTSDARNVRRRFFADARGAVWRESDEFGNSRRAFYNAFGAVDETESRQGLRVRYNYDAIGRLTKRAWPKAPNFGGGADTVFADSVRYVYDIMGNILADSNREGTITRTYYGDNSVRTRVANVGGLDSLKYFYDATGARVKLIHWSAKARDSVLYAYNASGDLFTLTVFFGAPGDTSRILSFEWDSLGRRRTVTYPNGAVSFAYDGGGTLRRVLGTGTGRFNFSLRNTTVDPAGNIRVEANLCNPLTGDTFPQGSLCGGGGALTTTSTFNRLGELIKQNRTPGGPFTDSMMYDVSGNMTYRKRNTQIQRWTFKTGLNGQPTNRIDSQTVAPKELFGYNQNGARRFVQVGNPFIQKYWYDALGRTSGVASTGPDAQLGPNQCRYDPDGQMYNTCDDAAPFLSFDGNNVVLAFEDEWRFVQGPAVDDPIIGLLRPAVGLRRLLYFITDGNGRQLMVTDSSGKLDLADVSGPGNPRGNWSYAGATSAANTFNGDRQSPPNMPTVALFRNRVYDLQTARWTQEDPIGIEEGLNLYQFNGNNPVAYSDPFGLNPCYRSPVACLQAFASSVRTLGRATVGLVRAAGGALKWIGEGWKQLGQRVASRLGGSPPVITEQLANKLHHTFDKPGHNLGQVVSQFGSQLGAFQAIEGATRAAQVAGRLQVNAEGVFRATVQVGYNLVTVTGRIVDGVAQVGTAFIP